MSLTLAAVPFVPPPGTSILSFAVTINGITLAPANGCPVNIALNAATYAGSAAIDAGNVASSAVNAAIHAANAATCVANSPRPSTNAARDRL